MHTRTPEVGTQAPPLGLKRAMELLQALDPHHTNESIIYFMVVSSK